MRPKEMKVGTGCGDAQVGVWDTIGAGSTDSPKHSIGGGSSSEKSV